MLDWEFINSIKCLLNSGIFNESKPCDVSIHLDLIAALNIFQERFKNDAILIPENDNKALPAEVSESGEKTER